MIYEKLQQRVDQMHKLQVEQIDTLDSVNESLFYANEAITMLSALYQQDEDDKYSISLYGIKESKVQNIDTNK